MKSGPLATLATRVWSVHKCLSVSVSSQCRVSMVLSARLLTLASTMLMIMCHQPTVPLKKRTQHALLRALSYVNTLRAQLVKYQCQSNSKLISCGRSQTLHAPTSWTTCSFSTLAWWVRSNNTLNSLAWRPLCSLAAPLVFSSFCSCGGSTTRAWSTKLSGTAPRLLWVTILWNCHWGPNRTKDGTKKNTFQVRTRLTMWPPSWVLRSTWSRDLKNIWLK